jgi:hypothetical protein
MTRETIEVSRRILLEPSTYVIKTSMPLTMRLAKIITNEAHDRSVILVVVVVMMVVM